MVNDYITIPNDYMRLGIVSVKYEINGCNECSPQSDGKRLRCVRREARTYILRLCKRTCGVSRTRYVQNYIYQQEICKSDDAGGDGARETGTSEKGCWRSDMAVGGKYEG